MAGATDRRLRGMLESMDRRGYPAYKGLRGTYDFGDFELSIDHVQGDPFAAPSKVSVFVPHSVAGFPRALFDEPHRRTAFEDFLVRRFGRELARWSFKARGSGKSGLLATSRPGPEVLQRTACSCGREGVTMRFEAGFPANGRSVNAAELDRMLFDYVPRCVGDALLCDERSLRAARAAADLADDQRALRREIERRGLVAFVANGSVLPRESGVSSLPMKGAVPFASPSSLEVEVELPHRGRVRGMGVPRGVTLIVGGGYHGKSTLLKALETGVYDHVAGDGRELVATDATAVKLRAEDGRSVRNVDISLFIDDLPNKKDTRRFSTEDASGSTSQAAAVVEAVEAGCRTFLIDEDTSATNFMVRDALMQQVVSREHEPITPFIERVRDLYEKAGVSTVLVAGSSGSFFYTADTVIQMDCYEPHDITASVRSFCAGHAAGAVEAAPGFRLPGRGRRLADGFPARTGAPEHGGRGGRPGRGGRDDRIKVRVHDREGFALDRVDVDLRGLEQLVDAEQTCALAQMLRYCVERRLLGRLSVEEVVDEVFEQVERCGLSAIGDASYASCGLALPRRQELFACIDRYRG